MPRIPQYHSRTTTPITSAPLLRPTRSGREQVLSGALAEQRGVSNIGQSMQQLASVMENIKTAEDTAKGMAEYQGIMNDYQLSLKDKDPSEYLEQGPDGQYQLPKDVQARIDAIGKNLSPRAHRNLNNRFGVLNESHRTGIASRMVRDKSAQMAESYDLAAQNYSIALAKGDDEAAMTAKAAMDDLWQYKFKSEDGYKADLQAATINGTIEGNKEQMAQAVQSGAFDMEGGDIDMDAIESAASQMTQDATERTSLIRHAINESNVRKAKVNQINEAAVEKFKADNYQLEIGTPEQISQAIENYEATNLLTVDEKRSNIAYLTRLLEAKSKGNTSYVPAVYDEALSRVRDVKYAPEEQKKQMFEDTREWLLQEGTLESLGGMHDDISRALYSASEPSTSSEKNVAVGNAVTAVNKYFDSLIETNEKSIFKKQEIMDAIETNGKGMTPSELQKYTQELLKPIQAEKAEEWYEKIWNGITGQHSAIFGHQEKTGLTKGQKLFRTAFAGSGPRLAGRIMGFMRDEPKTEEEFNRQYQSLLLSDEEAAEKYYVRWMDSF